MLQIKNLFVSLGGKELLRGVNLETDGGARHLLRGANGSGKTTIAQTVAGNPDYGIVSGEIIFDGQDITNMTAAERALLGIFLGAQNVPEIPGLTVSSFLKHSLSSHAAALGCELKAGEFFQTLAGARERLDIPESWMSRSINVGFSGGERKRLMMMRLLMLRPKLAILDEPDSGVDTVTQKMFAEIIMEMSDPRLTTFLIISHQEKFTEMITPTAITTLDKGKVVI
ncbi:MAG: Fe-S cluster assembly ATPase SufC [Rickettsiales bacterium]|jgi:Fe-S cluster assembly ATP-binding protein|nr:Fe-S cluster assembly ATPase SufC [Rickettsiales bacterium]